MEYPIAAQWLKANAQVIEDYRAAASRTHLYHPVVLPKTRVLMDAPLSPVMVNGVPVTAANMPLICQSLISALARLP